jgi:hypothetical protein
MNPHEIERKIPEYKWLDFWIPKDIYFLIKANFWNKSKLIKQYLKEMQSNPQLAQDIKQNYILGRDYIKEKEVSIRFNLVEYDLLKKNANDCPSLSSVCRAILVYHAIKYGQGKK